MRMLTSCFLVAVLSAGAAGAESAAPADSGSEASVAFRNEATKRFEAPSAATVKEMAARAQTEAPAVEELAALGLREEAVAVRAGGVKLRLRGGLRSALLAEEREGRVVLACEGAPAAATEPPQPAPGDAAEVRP